MGLFHINHYYFDLMKIAYTISGIYNSGGMENILLQKANYLAEELEYDVTIITTDQDSRDTFFKISPKIKTIDLGVNYYKWRHTLLWHIIKTLLKYKHYKRLKKILFEQKYDIVISLMDFDLNLLHKIKDGSKKVLESHFSKYRKSIASTNRLMSKIQYLRANSWNNTVMKYNRFVVLTEEDRQQWKNVQNCRVIPNFITKQTAIKSQLKNKKVISIGRFTRQKGFDLLLKAWQQVVLKYPDWILTIIGGGDKTEYECLISQLNLTKSVVLKDPTNNIEYEYIDSSLYVLSSRYEGLPLVLLEAMSFGLPIVSFKCPCGPLDIVKPEFGTLVEPNDCESLAKAIIEWIESDQKRMQAGEIAKECVQYYQQANIMKKWDSLFNELIKS